jgi:hypothetical protein
LLSLISLLKLLDLILVDFNIVTSIFVWNIWIGRLFSSVMESCFLFWFVINQFVLGFVSELLLYLS